MKKAELSPTNFDAGISKIEIEPKNMDSTVVFASKMYDEAAGCSTV